MNANEIARGLRYCYSEDMVCGCNGCPYHDRENDTCTTEKLELQAADLIESLQAQLAENETTAIAERETLQQWVNDLQSGMYVNCVYCGHRYGPSETTPVSMADALKEHIENCPKHPMSALKAQLAESQRRERAARLEVCRRCPDGEIIDGVKHYPCDGCEWRGPQDGE